MQDDYDMEHLILPTSKNNPDGAPAGLTRALQHQRLVFAAELTQAAFGRFYVPPEHGDFVNRSSVEIQAVRRHHLTPAELFLLVIDGSAP